MEQQGGVWCHVTRRGWDSHFCGGFSFHKCATAGVFYNNNDDFTVTILACSAIFRDGYKSIDHRGASRYENVG
jgi:hypothetical protein